MSRTADEIRDDLCANLQTEFRAIDVRVVTADGSPFWALASALALEVEGPEAEAAAAMREPFPATASTDGVQLQADAAGLTSIEASAATLRVRVTGTSSSTLAIGAGKQLTSPAGLVFLAPDASVTFDGSGVGYTSVTARDAGSSGNLTAGTVLSWQGAPTGFGSAATCAAAPGDDTHVLVVGADAEDIDVGLRARVAAWRKERAQAGNRAEWVEWLLRVKGVGDAYVYPREWWNARLGVLEPDLPGVLVAVVLSAAPPAASYVQNPDNTVGLGLDPAYRRAPTPTLNTRARRYIEGTHDAFGVPVPGAIQKQLRSIDIGAANYALLIPGETAVDITIALDTDPSVAPWPWGIDDAPTRTITARTSTTLTLNTATGITAGSRLAVDLAPPFPGVSPARGGYWLAAVQGVSGNVVTLTQALPSLPEVGALVRPDCGLWSEARRLVLGSIDQMGPGDETNTASLRFPRPADHGIDKLFQSRLVALVQNVTGVVGVSVIAPASSSVSPGVTGLIIPGKVVFEPPP